MQERKFKTHRIRPPRDKPRMFDFAWDPALRERVREAAYEQEVSMGRVIRMALYAWFGMSDPELISEEQDHENEHEREGITT